MPCGDFENQCYIQTRAEAIYMCADPIPGYKKGSYESAYCPCSGWDMIGWTTPAGEYVSPTYYYPTECRKDNWGKKIKGQIFSLRKLPFLPIVTHPVQPP
jgi:hypothetical protein